MNKLTTVAIDLGKHTFQIGFANAAGKEIREQQRKRSRAEFAEFVGKLEPGVSVVMEVGHGAQAWARCLKERGIKVRLLPAQLVAKHRVGPKNDPNDVRALLRAATDSQIHEVPIKTQEQLALQAMHRGRQGWVQRRTAIANQVRGLLVEHDIVIAKGSKALAACVERVLPDAAVPLPSLLRDLIATLMAEWRHLGERIEAMDHDLARLAAEDPIARRIDAIPGVGAVIATAIAVKAVELKKRFPNCRRFAASFGLVPEQHSSSDKVRLGHMTKRGDRYLRSLLVCGAQSVVRQLPRRTERHDRDTERLRRWHARHGTKGAAIRLANHNLRTMYALLTRDQDYRMD